MKSVSAVLVNCQLIIAAEFCHLMADDFDFPDVSGKPVREAYNEYDENAVAVYLDDDDKI